MGISMRKLNFSENCFLYFLYIKSSQVLWKRFCICHLKINIKKFSICLISNLLN